MRTVYLLVGLLLIGLLSWFYQNNTNCCGKAKQTQKLTNAFTLRSNGLKVDCEYQAFTRSNYRLIQSIDPNSDCYKQVAAFLEKNPNKALFIDGKYAEGEENNSIYGNLGQARASQIKQLLVSTFGIPARQIKTGYQLVEDTAFRTDTLFDGYRFKIDKLSTNDLSNFDASRSITLNFNTGSSIPIMTPEIRNDFSQFINFIEANPDAVLQVTGHTDTEGDADNNMVLGQNRADEIKDYLIQNGISGSRISTTSKGEEEPISEINAENRRVVISIQN